MTERSRLIFPNPEEKFRITGERYVSGLSGSIQHEHFHRYLFSAEYCAGKRVLDVACGEGYGCNLLAQVASEVVGLDIDADTVAYARRTYGESASHFIIGDATKLPFADASFDVITSFETIEHFADHDAFLDEVARVLRPNGVMIISSPNRDVYTEQNDYHNPFHVRELDREQFVAALRARFSNVSLLEQRPICGSILVEEQELSKMSTFETLDGLDFTKSSGVPAALYFVAVASNGSLPAVSSSVLFDNGSTARGEETLRQKVKQAEALASQKTELLAGADLKIATLEGSTSDLERQVAKLTSSLDECELRQARPSPSPAVPPDNEYRMHSGRKSPTFLIKLAAIWRYPTRSDRRKVYRMTAPALSSASSEHRALTNIGAILRHPFSRSARRAHRERLRAASAQGSIAWQPNAASIVKNEDADVASFQSFVRNAVSPSHGGEYVPEVCSDFVANSDSVKLIAYYLPQFHPIPENDEWWGRGFTEWRNVARAFPVYDGHYQPRMPGELGYYDLRVPDVMRRQVELARQYGISAFCFHFYWFGGKRLLEMPIENFLKNEGLDLEFSLCWANENWSRRWDGGNNELLIAQEHSPEDDIAFIRYLDRYFRDRRYMKIDGKPVLTVYRPGIIPDVRETLKRWRQEAEKMGYPGLYLIATNSFGFADHAALGFDALSEFPPHAAQAQQLHNHIPMSSARTGGNVYSYDSLVDWELSKQRPAGKIHPGVMPGWDNSARRPHDGHIFHGARPESFGRWLRSSTRWAARHPDGERLVFINAWNEWAEGAYLEPDARYGYAWAEEVRLSAKVASIKLAIVIHAFYEDIFSEILKKISLTNFSYKLFVTAPFEIEGKIRKMLEELGQDFVLRILENRGRDVLPFLCIYPDIRAEGFDIIVKVHTKKSTHRKDGRVWCGDILDKLLENSSLDRALAAFATDPTIGMIGPHGHCISLASYLGENKDRVFSIGARLGLSQDDVASQSFVAGTMFIARTEVFEPLVRLGFDDAAFEPEAGQKDGTLAHALERAMALSVKASGMRLASSDNTIEEITPEKHYRFAAKS